MLWQIKVRHTSVTLSVTLVSICLLISLSLLWQMWQTFIEKLLCYSLLKKAPVLSLKGRYLFWKALDLLKKRPCLLRWNSGSFGHDFTYVRIHSPVRMCGSLRDVRKKACFLVRDKTQCAQIYCKNDVADYKKEIHGYKKWELFSILFIIPYLCRVFHADTSVREVWESGKYIYIEKTFTWRFVLGTLKLRKFLTLPQTKQQ